MGVELPALVDEVVVVSTVVSDVVPVLVRGVVNARCAVFVVLVDIVLLLWNFPEAHKKFIFSSYIFGKKIPRDTILPF